MSYEFRKNMKKGNYVSTEKKETVAEVMLTHNTRCVIASFLLQIN
jgi:hypothetical protein